MVELTDACWSNIILQKAAVIEWPAIDGIAWPAKIKKPRPLFLILEESPSWLYSTFYSNAASNPQVVPVFNLHHRLMARRGFLSQLGVGNKNKLILSSKKDKRYFQIDIAFSAV
jgi:hypothetical protein